MFLLGGYMLFDRAFAWIHIPGTPLFVGEIILVAGLVITFRSRQMARFVRLSPPMQLLVAFMAFGLVLTMLGFSSYGLDAVRDGALWYYGLFALVIGTLATVWEPMYDYFIRWYSRIMPVLLVIGPLRAVLHNTNEQYLIPDSLVPLTSHKPGNLGVQAVLLTAFVLLVLAPQTEGVGRRDPARVRNTLLGLGGLALLALASTQNRGALVAGLIVFSILFFSARRARSILASVIALMIGVALLAFALDVRVELQRREVSIAQLWENFTTLNIATGDGDIQNDGTIAWRLALWDKVWDDTLSYERFLSGFGFGPNLASRYDFVAGGEGPELRNPHNSHLSVMARMGLIGVGLWLGLWISWYRSLLRARRRFRLAGEDQRAGFLAWCMLAALTILINGFFDPSLEGPQQAVWLWSIFGLGSLVAIEGNMVRWRQGGPSWATPKRAA